MNAPELKAAMARKDISIPKLAELIEINKKTMYSRFSGEIQFSLSEIKKIAEVHHLHQTAKNPSENGVLYLSGMNLT